MLYQEYYAEVLTVLDHVMSTQSEKIEQAGRIVADSVLADGLVYAFGCGHSHIIGEDLFYRAGGMAPVCAMLDSALMLHEGAVKSSCLERISGIAKPLFERYGMTRRDVLLVVSTSGINSVPVEMAECARREGIPVIAIVSNAYAEDRSRVPDGKRLYECADLVIDNGVCHGDAAVAVGDSGIRVGPISTISSCMIAQCIMTQAEEILWEKGVTLPVYVSGNLHGGMARNMQLIEKYRPRIRHL